MCMGMGLLVLMLMLGIQARGARSRYEPMTGL